MIDHPNDRSRGLPAQPRSTAAAARSLHGPRLLLCLLAASCAGGSHDRSTTVEVEAEVVASPDTDTSEEAVAPAPAPPPAIEGSSWTAVPAEGGPRPPFEVVPQEIHRLPPEGGPRFNITIGPRRRLALVGDVRGRFAVYDLVSGWARVSRRWSRGADPWVTTEAQGFDPSGQAVFEMSRENLCVFDLARDAGSCVSERLEVGASPVAGLGPGGRPLTYVAIADPGRDDTTRAELRAWEPGARESHVILSVPGFLRPGTYADQLEGGLAHASQGSRLALTNHHDTWLIDTGSHRVVSHVEGSVACAPPFDPTGRLLALASDGALELRDAATGELRHRVATEGAPRTIAWADDGESLAFCVGDGQAQRVNAVTGRSADVAMAACPDATLLVQGRRVRSAPEPIVVDEGASVLQIRGRPGRSHPIGSGELSLWGLTVNADGVVTTRRGASEHWGRDGMGEGSTPSPTSEASGFTVGSSASGRARLHWEEEGGLAVRRIDSPDVPLRDPLRVECGYGDADNWSCSTRAVFSPDETVLVITGPNRAATYEVTSGRRLGLMNIGRARPCADPCNAQYEVCVDGECNSGYVSEAIVDFSPSGQRLLVVADTLDTYLYDLGGQRLAVLARVSPSSLAELHQLHAFSADSGQLALVRRRALQVRSTTDGASRLEIGLPETLRYLSFSDDGSTLAAVTTRDRLLRVTLADGSVTDVGVLDGLRHLDPPTALAVICRDDRMYLRRLHTDEVRGPLGRCPSGGRFVVGPTAAFVGYFSGTLARVHRVSDGEVLNLRATDRVRLDEYDYPTHVGTSLIAFSDSGWFDMSSGQPTHVRVRAGASLDAEMASPEGSAHRREGLVAAFFSGRPLAAPPSPAGD